MVVLHCVPGLMEGLWSREVYGPANDPGNLIAAYEMELPQARVFELENQQRAITTNRARNVSVSRWINICRALAAATPIAFAVGAWVA